MRAALFLVSLLGMFLAAPVARAQDRYVVGFATRQSDGPGLTVVTDVSVDPDRLADEDLRRQFIARLGGRQRDFLSDIAVFDRREDAENFRKQLLDRASAAGAVEQLPVTVAEQSVGLWRQHANEFTAWPFDAVEAKRRQLRASQIWNLPVTMRAADRDFVLIPPGEFVMGSPPDEAGRGPDETQHRVRITTPYYLARDDEPFDLNGWAESLAKIFKTAPEGYRFRLPTEAEWEYAARAGTENSRYATDGTIPGQYGDPVDMLTWNAREFESWRTDLKQEADQKGGKFFQLYASCQKRSASGFGSVPLPSNPLPCRNLRMSLDEVRREGLEPLVELAEKPGPGPARRFQPNAWGLYDVLGRYDEAVTDTYLPYPADAITINPRQEKDLLYVYRTGRFEGLPGKGFIMRGGHFADAVGDMRVARRRQAGYSFIWYNYIAPNGLRLVLEKATGEARSDEHGDPLLRALKAYQQTLGPQEKTGPDPLPDPKRK